MKQLPAHEAPVDEGSRRLGLAAVAVLTVIIGVAVVLMSFSTVNTPMSVDGDKNTESQWYDSGE